VETTVFAVAPPGEEASVTSRRGYLEQHFVWDYPYAPVIGRLRMSGGLRRALRSDANVIHSHGLWLLPNIEAGRAAASRGQAHLLSPRGMLSAASLEISPWRKKLVWVLIQRALVRRASCIHATSQDEYEDVRALGLRNPVAVVPNGIDLPAPPSATASCPAQRTLLSLGRLHKKKGLTLLLRAWAKVEPHRPSWRLRIVGPAELGHDRELRSLVHELHLAQVTVEGPLYGQDKLGAYRSSQLFVLPTLSENFGIVAAEALAAGVPVVSTKGAPWGGLEQEGCGWWTDIGSEPLARALLEATALPPQHLVAMGERGRAWMARDFSWDRVAREMARVYLWLTGEAAAPETVRFE
jgi:glycosyltransferase involved in cell wall biosynthesis